MYRVAQLCGLLIFASGIGLIGIAIYLTKHPDASAYQLAVVTACGLGGFTLGPVVFCCGTVVQQVIQIRRLLKRQGYYS